MKRINEGIMAAVAVAGLAVAGPLALAHGEASSKHPGYDSDARTSSGFDPLPIPGVVSLGSSDAHSHTSDTAPATSTSSGAAPSVLGLGGGTVDCGASGGGAGADREERSAGLLDEDLGIARVAVLVASCKASALKTDNAAGTARSSALEVSTSDVDVAVISSSSDADTTSGNSRADGSFAVLRVGDRTVAGCTSSARANNGTHDASAEQTLVVAGVALPAGACPGSSQSSYSRTSP